MKKTLLVILLLFGISLAKTDTQKERDNQLLFHPFKILSVLDNGYWIQVDYHKHLINRFSLVTALTIREDQDLRGFDKLSSTVEKYQYEKYTLGLGLKVETFTKRLEHYLTASFTSGYFKYYEDTEYSTPKRKRGIYLGGEFIKGMTLTTGRFLCVYELGVKLNNKANNRNIFISNFLVGFTF